MTPDKAQSKPQIKGQRASSAIQDRLRELAFNATTLADCLGVPGDPLTEDQRLLVSMANLPVLKEAFQTATMEYLSGVPRSQILDNIALNLSGI